ncbi:MAG: hypothetical protein A3I66_03580 [Burkholderiales bacterium RIFCSPLOWO2_02_FULL_57_36]|nr:MAG: hypothetical protein A3I66_03580 [Burkholderiales bacterium RIFCSPLOWO2_02_FULL_57_36]
MPESKKELSKDKAGNSPKRFSSQGDSPVEMAPKDVSPKHATWQDRTERHTKSKDQDERADALLDEASDLSFPASDPIAVSSSTRLVKDKDGKLHPASEKPKDQD